MNPLVSIGVPVYNTAKYIEQTLDSIKNQTYSNIEIIVVDDGSTDDSKAKVESWSKKNNVDVNLISNQRNLGLTQACNIILSNAKGKYLQKVDADDILLGTKIERHIQVLERLGEETALVYSDVNLIDENSNLIKQDYFDRLEYDGKKSGDTYLDLLKINFIPNPSVLARIDVIKKLGGYDNDLLFEDWDLWLRITAKYKIFFDSAVTCCYRIHKNSMMTDDAKAVQRNNTNVIMFKKNIGVGEKYDALVMNRLKDLMIYSYFKKDPESKSKLNWYLHNRFDLKVFIYFILSSVGLRHPSVFLKKLKASF